MSKWYFRLHLQYVSLNWCNSSFNSVLQIYVNHQSLTDCFTVSPLRKDSKFLSTSKKVVDVKVDLAKKKGRIKLPYSRPHNMLTVGVSLMWATAAWECSDPQKCTFCLWTFPEMWNAASSKRMIFFGNSVYVSSFSSRMVLANFLCAISCHLEEINGTPATCNTQTQAFSQCSMHCPVQHLQLMHCSSSQLGFDLHFYCFFKLAAMI
jgi:hypothetical protein